jgi:hypothetical protein
MDRAERRDIREAFQVFSDAALEIMAGHAPADAEAYYSHVTAFVAALYAAERAYTDARLAFGAPASATMLNSSSSSSNRDTNYSSSSSNSGSE